MTTTTAPSVYTQKRGATLSLTGTASGLPSGNWDATATVRKGNQQEVEDLQVTLVAGATPDDPYVLTLEATSTQTADWPVKDLYCDIRFFDNSSPPVVLLSPTFVIRVQQEESGG